jgi:HEAT repeat protein
MQQTPAPKPTEAPKPRPPKPTPPPEFQAAKLEALGQAELILLLKDEKSTTFEKAKACQRLGRVGTAQAVPALAALLPDAQLSHYARYGLEPIPGPAADDALRAAVPKLKGRLLIGVINSIGFRRDEKAVPLLAKMLTDADIELAQAAAAALGETSGPAAAKTLQDGLARAKAPMRTAIAAAALVCAERLVEQGDRAQGLALYSVLTATDIPKSVRLAAMHGIIGTETSLRRPR